MGNNTSKGDIWVCKTSRNLCQRDYKVARCVDLNCVQQRSTVHFSILGEVSGSFGD
jgi:hypothetical protein